MQGTTGIHRAVAAALLIGGWLAWAAPTAAQGLAAEGSQGDRPYLAAARDAGLWLRSVAVETPAGLTWPADPDDTSAQTTNLYHGSSGVVLFLLELAEATGDESFLIEARRGADALAASLPDAVDPTRGQASLYTGVAGVGFALHRAFLATGEPRYRDAASACVQRILDGVASRGWGETTDIVRGVAGTGLFLLYAHREWQAPGALEGAKRAGAHLLSRADETDHGVRWRMTPDYPRIMPNFSHGTAGVAYFLAALGDATGQQRFIEAAQAGADQLMHLARVASKPGLIQHHDGDGEDLFYLSWCHGPAGTGRLFHLLGELTGDARYAAQLERSVQATLALGAPAARSEGHWNNVGQCCGSAGLGEFFLSLHEATGQARYLRAAKEAGDDILKRATRAGEGLKWIQAEHRVRPDFLVAQTGYMQGAAGIGLFLLRLDAALQGERAGVALPDSPFAID